MRNKYYFGSKSANFDGNKFFNFNPQTKKLGLLALLKWKMFDKGENWPDLIENEKFDIPPERVGGNEIRISFVGHITFLIQMENINILTDPWWGERASPLPFLGPKRVIAPGIKLEDLPPIDLILLSHNHYDHLDMATLNILHEKFNPKIITCLGNDTILKNHNPKMNVSAYNWGDHIELNDKIKLYIAEVQHWSARHIFDTNHALWCGFVISSPRGNIFFSGDTGFAEGRPFQIVKDKFKDFLISILPIGAYEPRWFMEYAHMNPEEAVLAHKILGAKCSIPAHFRTVKLSNESYMRPISDLKEALKKHSIAEEEFKALNIGEAFKF